MSLENVTADASAEHNEDHKLHFDQLVKLDDAGALFQCGHRLTTGISAEQNASLGLSLVEAARCGHAVAFGISFLLGQGVRRDQMQALELF